MELGATRCLGRGLRCACLLLSLTLLGGAENPSAELPRDGAARLQASEARLAELRKRVDDRKAAHQATYRATVEKYDKEVAELRQALEESRAEAESLQERILQREQDNLTMSNETVAVIGRLRAELAAGRGGTTAYRGPAQTKGAVVVDRACTQCRGSGVVTHQEMCEACKGAGNFAKVSSVYRRTGTHSTSTAYDRCANCKGKGQVTVRDACSICNGTGRVPLDR